MATDKSQKPKSKPLHKKNAKKQKRKVGNVDEHSISSLKAAIRSTSRLLAHDAAHPHLPATARQENERALQALKCRLGELEKEKKQKEEMKKLKEGVPELVAKGKKDRYKKVKFFEAQKARKNIRRAEKELKKDPENSKLKERLEMAQLELRYITEYPDKKYIALYREADEAGKARKKEIFELLRKGAVQKEDTKLVQDIKGDSGSGSSMEEKETEDVKAEEDKGDGFPERKQEASLIHANRDKIDSPLEKSEPKFSDEEQSTPKRTPKTSSSSSKKRKQYEDATPIPKKSKKSNIIDSTTPTATPHPTPGLLNILDNALQAANDIASPFLSPSKTSSKSKSRKASISNGDTGPMPKDKDGQSESTPSRAKIADIISNLDPIQAIGLTKSKIKSPKKDKREKGKDRNAASNGVGIGTSIEEAEKDGDAFFDI